MVIIYEDEKQLTEKCLQYEAQGATLASIEEIEDLFKTYDKAQREYEKLLKAYEVSKDKNKVKPERPNIKSPIGIGESIGFLIYTYDYNNRTILHKSYKPMINLMKRILCRNKYYTSNRKSKITVNYAGENYQFTDILDWETPLDKDGVRHFSKLNLLLKDKIAEQREYVEQNKEQEFVLSLLAYIDKPELSDTKKLYPIKNRKLPEDMDSILETFAPLYDIQIRYNSEFELEDKIRAYQSIKWYLDNGIEYCKDILGYKPDEEKMFEAVSFGDENYLEDVIYQGVC